jgi:hypothetical protein
VKRQQVQHWRIDRLHPLQHAGCGEGLEAGDRLAQGGTGGQQVAVVLHHHIAVQHQTAFGL